MERGRGVVVFYDAKANYGYIEPEDGSADVVFKIPPGERPLAVGDHVVYDLIPRLQVTPRGPEALRVWKVGFAPPLAV